MNLIQYVEQLPDDTKRLYYRLQRVIEAEQGRIAVLRDTDSNDELLVARGRLKAWMVLSNTLVGIEDNLIDYE